MHQIVFVVAFSNQTHRFSLEKWKLPLPNVGQRLKFEDVENGGESCFCTVMDVLHCPASGKVEVTLGKFNNGDPEAVFDSDEQLLNFVFDRIQKTLMKMLKDDRPTRMR